MALEPTETKPRTGWRGGRLNWGRILALVAVSFWLLTLGNKLIDYINLEKNYKLLVKGVKTREKKLRLATEGRSFENALEDYKTNLVEFTKENRVYYSNAEILNHLSLLSEAAYLEDISPRIQSVKQTASYKTTRLFVGVKGKYHSIAKFINLLEQKKYRYPVAVRKLTIKRSTKNPGGSLLASMEVLFYHLPESLARKIWGNWEIVDESVGEGVSDGPVDYGKPDGGPSASGPSETNKSGAVGTKKPGSGEIQTETVEQ